MSEKKMDRHNRWRDKTVVFRMSPQENAQLDMRVAVSGLTKQEYLINRVLEQEIIVNLNPRVEKNLRIYLQLLKTELETITAQNRLPTKFATTFSKGLRHAKGFQNRGSSVL